MNLIQFNKKKKTTSFREAVEWLSPEINNLNKIIFKLVDHKLPLISELTNYIISSGGKRIRPLLTLACAKLCNYSGDRHIALSAVIEFIHTATLLHDDVIDNSKKRRGRKTANLVWDNKSSILVGDYLLSYAFRILVKDGSLKCIDRITNASKKITEGEVKQLLAINKIELSEADYLDIIDYKTAELFSAACEISGELSEVSEQKKQALSDFGRYLGTSFQIIDDLMDYFSNEKSIGKEIGNDFREGNISLPLILCFKRCNNKEKSFIKILNKKVCINNKAIKEIIFLMEKYNVKSDCVNKARHFALMGKDCLGNFPESENKNKIISLVDILLERTA